MHNARHFARHYLEMVAAMFIGMFVLGGAFFLAFAAIGVDIGDWDRDAPALSLLGMGFTMTVPMIGWMHYRGHGRTALLDMTAAMVAPTLIAVALLSTDIAFDTLMAFEHVAMLVLMLVAMLARPGEYVHAHA